jgi:hypothetical protein
MEGNLVMITIVDQECVDVILAPVIAELIHKFFSCCWDRLAGTTIISLKPTILNTIEGVFKPSTGKCFVLIE